jgi:hypothetical protein
LGVVGGQGRRGAVAPTGRGADFHTQVNVVQLWYAAVLSDGRVDGEKRRRGGQIIPPSDADS